MKTGSILSQKDSGRTVIILSLLLLGACGFQLRGTGPADLGLSSVAIVASPEFAETRTAFAKSVSERDVSVVADVSAGEFLVEIVAVRNYRRPVSTTRNLGAAQYELRQEVDIVISSGADVLTPLATLVAERIYALDSGNLSGSYEEQRFLQAEMRDELALMMLRRLEALGRGRASP